jgi:hypothetical protein
VKVWPPPLVPVVTERRLKSQKDKEASEAAAAREAVPPADILKEIQGPLLKEADVRLVDCILMQYLECCLVSETVRELPKYIEAMRHIKDILKTSLGEGYLSYATNDDFYTKWGTGGAGHAIAVVLSDATLLPGAGIVGMVHQLFTDKVGVTVSNKVRELKRRFAEKHDTSPELIRALEGIRVKWISNLPEALRSTYEGARFLEEYMRLMLK